MQHEITKEIPLLDAQGNLTLRIVEAATNELAAEVGHVYDVAVFKFALHALDLGGVDPGMAAADAGFAGLAKGNLCHCDVLLYSSMNTRRMASR